MIIIKAQAHRSQEKNKSDAMQRLQEMVAAVANVAVLRRPTRPTRSSQRKRLHTKTLRGEIKSLRGKVRE